MGCVPSRKNDTERVKIITPSITPFYLNAIYQKILDSSENEVDFDIKCRKFKIPDPEEKIFRINLKSLYDIGIFGSVEHANEMEIILNDYKDFISSQSFFYSNVHFVCMPDFCLEKGLIVLTTTLMANQLRVTFDNVCPYLKIVGLKENHNELINSWNDFAQMLEKIYGKYKKIKFYHTLMVKTSAIIRKYENFTEKNAKKRIKYLKLLRSLVAKYFKSIKETKQRIIMFIDFFIVNKEKIEQIGQVAESKKLLSCEKIVHGSILDATDQNLTQNNN
ncbi:hypothetical protein SteCoe_9275 [Stentor coeruleus]|uniref:Uncharacterized protein n=1 Tax=Stentor coeruleus TaxID=5963 RepID=A0A1R2CIA8_9CILI|nr:hypothetical protein SteCoe_9275 [Stentor coeruleus]